MTMHRRTTVSFERCVTAFLSRLFSPLGNFTESVCLKAECVCALPSFANCERFSAKGLDTETAACDNFVGRHARTHARTHREHNALFSACQPLFGTFCSLFEYFYVNLGRAFCALPFCGFLLSIPGKRHRRKHYGRRCGLRKSCKKDALSAVWGAFQTLYTVNMSG